jgi:hypothetical protein
MRKITLSALLTLLSCTMLFAQFPEGFETSVPPEGWRTFIGVNGEGTGFDWTTTTIAASGSQAAFVRYEPVANQAEDWLVTPQFTPTAAANILTFQQRLSFSFADFGTVYTVRVSTASQTDHADFDIVDTQTETDFGTVYSAHNVDLSAYNGVPIYVAFVMTNNNGDNWYVDDVDLIADANPPTCASNPTPADGATDVDVSGGAVVIAWDAPTTGDPATSYEVFWGTTSGDLTSLGSLSNTTVSITGIEFSTTYYWSIVPSNVGGSATGCAEWSFTTEAAPPPPANDACEDATAVVTLPFNDSVDASSASNNNGPITDCGGGMNDGVWYSFTPSASGTIDIVVDNVAGWDPELALYSGSCGAFTCIDSVDSGITGDGESLLAVPVDAGVTYFINVGFYSGFSDGAEGPFSIDISGSAVLNTSEFKSLDFSFYPNPTDGMVQFETVDTVDRITVFNMLGQQVLSAQPKAVSPEFDMTALQPGAYFLRVVSGGVEKTVRVIRN